MKEEKNTFLLIIGGQVRSTYSSEHFTFKITAKNKARLFFQDAPFMFK